MRHTHHGGRERRDTFPDDRMEHPHGRDHHHRGRHRGSRPFDYGELRLLALAMIAEAPRHGYELMKAIEDRMGGTYTPSPGVMYPTLSWLDDMGYTRVDAQEPGRKRYQVTEEGQAFLTANRAGLDALHSRLGRIEGGPARDILAPVLRGMENLKLALRLRLQRGTLDAQAAEAIALALDAAAQTVERT
ncbi:MAG: PadR family transcriptional regulator [Rhodospirillales bacterium]|nr:PadR family transcriptional regulator [Acetobacter sp.]